MPKLRLIVSVDALRQPLTGIGRYTLELVKGLRRHEFRQLRYYRNERWIPDPFALLTEQDPAHAAAPNRRFTVPARVRRAYWHTTCRFNVFHSPNYFLPPYADRGVITVHDLSVLKFPESHPKERVLAFERSFRSSIDRAVHLITDSETVRQEVVEEFRLPPSRVTAIPLGVGPEYHPRPHTEIAAHLATFGLEAGCYSLCVSTIEPRKRIEGLVLAYGRMASDLRQRFPLVIVGAIGWKSETAVEAMAEGQQAGWLKHLGYVPTTMLPLLYSGAAVFIYPSIYEGFGLPVAEAMASGVPTVTSHRSCLPEVASGAARLIDPDDIDGMSACIAESILDEAWRQDARLRGRKVAADYSWDRCVDRTVEAYELADSRG